MQEKHFKAVVRITSLYIKPNNTKHTHHCNAYITFAMITVYRENAHNQANKT